MKVSSSRPNNTPSLSKLVKSSNWNRKQRLGYYGQPRSFHTKSQDISLQILTKTTLLTYPWVQSITSQDPSRVGNTSSPKHPSPSCRQGPEPHFLAALCPSSNIRWQASWRFLPPENKPFFLHPCSDRTIL